MELLAQIDADAAGRHLGDEIRRPFDVVILADPDLSTPLRPDEQEGVRLGFVVQIQADASVISGLDSRGVRLVVSQPGDEPGVRVTMPRLSDRRGHVDLSFDQLGLLEVRHRIVAAFELVTRQAVAILQRRDRSFIERFDRQRAGSMGSWRRPWDGLPGRRWLSSKRRSPSYDTADRPATRTEEVARLPDVLASGPQLLSDPPRQARLAEPCSDPTAARVVGWVKPTRARLSPVGFTHPTNSRSPRPGSAISCLRRSEPAPATPPVIRICWL